VVEIDVHRPTDSTLLGDTVRVKRRGQSGSTSLTEAKNLFTILTVKSELLAVLRTFSADGRRPE
jgi:hypothetical protein